MYQRIMDDVIENCQTTFEEDGVNQQTLDDLRKVGLFSLVSVMVQTINIFARSISDIVIALSLTRFEINRVV